VAAKGTPKEEIIVFKTFRRDHCVFFIAKN
jgi:hypothetical protein